jgi:acyl-coenzyme A synthetase/AMP-(fatty) acid ligase
MPTKSSFPDVDIPDVDLWAFMFERKHREFSDDQGICFGRHTPQPRTDQYITVIYRACNSDRHYTFAQVKQAATTFGEGLQEDWEWQRGDVLNIYAPNDIDIAPVIYGAFFAGGVVSPANPGYSPDELAFQLTNSESKAIVTTKDFLPAALKAAQKAGIAEDRILLLGAQHDETRKFRHWTRLQKSLESRIRRRKAKARDMAYLVYSSGTTYVLKWWRFKSKVQN